MSNLPLMHFADANSAAAHLLRHLHDARALRNNPLVAHIFAQQDGENEPQTYALTRVHELVIATAEKLFGDRPVIGRDSLHRQRQLEIIMRCDIRGQLHKAVQQDLGIGKRQFYRERQRARKALARAFEALVPASLSETNLALDRHGLALTAIKAARIRGDDNGALNLVQRELSIVSAPAHRFELLVLLAEILADAGDFEDARSAIEDARRTSAANARSRGRVLQVSAQLHATEGRFPEAARFCEESVSAFNELPLPRRIEDEEQIASTLLLSCLANHNAGFYEKALGSLASARDIIERRPPISMLLRVQLLMHLGASQILLPGSQTLVKSHLLEAKALAERNGFIREVVSCSLYLSKLHANEEAWSALELGREALAMAKQVYGAAIYAWLCVEFARRENEHGNFYGAIELARTARAGNNSTVCTAAANVIEAEAQLRLDHCDRAHVLASRTVNTLRAAGNDRMLGEVLCVASQAAFRLGRLSEARRAIDESVALLQQYGNHRSLSKALYASSTIVDATNAS